LNLEGHSLKTLIRTLLLLGSLRRAAALTIFTVFRRQRLLLPRLTATTTRTFDDKTVRSRFAVSPLPCARYEQNKQQRLSGIYFAGMPHSILTNNCSLTINVAFIFNRLNNETTAIRKPITIANYYRYYTHTYADKCKNIH
jgi:hypothetical protein